MVLWGFLWFFVVNQLELVVTVITKFVVSAINAQYRIYCKKFIVTNWSKVLFSLQSY